MSGGPVSVGCIGCTMDRFYTNSEGHDTHAEGEAIRWLLGYAKQRESDRAAIVIPSAGDSENLKRVIGGEDASRLGSEREIDVGGVKLELRVLRGLSHAQIVGPVVTLWCLRQEVETVERLDPPALCAVQWKKGDLGEWARTWGAINLLTGESERSGPAPPVIRGAVMAMSRGGDMLHPNDRRATIQALKILLLQEIQVDPEIICTEALRQGWSPSGVDRLRKVATKVAEGRRVQGGGKVTKTMAKAAVARWEAAGQVDSAPDLDT